VNLEQRETWRLRPGSETDPIGGALRRALAAKTDRLPNELARLLDELAKTRNPRRTAWNITGGDR